MNKTENLTGNNTVSSLYPSKASSHDLIVKKGCRCFFLLNFVLSAAAAAKSLQSCLTLCDPIDGSPPGPAVPGVL